MQEVSSGTNETAESVQNQLGKTEEIQNHIGQMADVMETITQRMAETKDSVRLGRENLQTLTRQMEHSEKAGTRAVEEMKELAEHTANMQAIIDMITNVASQTSLLSLNASMRRARRGSRKRLCGGGIRDFQSGEPDPECHGGYYRRHPQRFG